MSIYMVRQRNQRRPVAGMKLKFHALSVFPLLAGGVKPRRDVQVL